MTSVLFIYKCLVQLSLEKPPLVADGNTWRDPQSDIMHRERGLEILSRNQNRSIKSLPTGIREEKKERARGDEAHQGSPTQRDQCTHELTNTEATNTRPHQKGSQSSKEKWTHASIPNKKLSPNGNNLKININFFPMETHRGNKLLLREGCMPSSKSIVNRK